MTAEICRVLICLAIGEGASRFCPLPLAGSVLGLLLLFSWVVVLGKVPTDLGALADQMLSLFGLFFVPAGVGVMLYKPLIHHDFIPIFAAIAIGTTVTVCVTGLTATLVVAREIRDRQK